VEEAFVPVIKMSFDGIEVMESHLISYWHASVIANE
jgi:hypothetical protein